MFRYQSGRVISLGRVMLAAAFLATIWWDRTQPLQSPTVTYASLTFYLLFALGLAIVTWRNWWLDARLAVASHLVDMALFALIVFSTDGYTSPFFLVVILPLLAAAIRWGARATLATAVVLIILYVCSGLFAANAHQFEFPRFVIRTTHLVILSAALTWFQLHQQFVGPTLDLDDSDVLIGGGTPLDLVLQQAMKAAGASSGALLVRNPDDDSFAGVRIGDGRTAAVALAGPLLRDSRLGGAVLFDCRRNRMLGKRPAWQMRFARASSMIDGDAAATLDLDAGLIAEIHCGSQDGWLVLENIPDMSVDYVDFGRRLALAVGAMLDRSALLSAVEEGVAAQTRLGLARDVHDGLAQFLAGAAMRIEAIGRSARAGAAVDDDLANLKRLVVEEQHDIRSFVSALRRGRDIALPDALEDLSSLASKLGQQWSVDCRIGGPPTDDLEIPIRVHFDLQQLLREAVANAVRHGKATRVSADLRREGDRLLLDVFDNGTGFAKAASSPFEPWSLKERIDRAQGSLLIRSEVGETQVSISLPLIGGRA